MTGNNGFVPKKRAGNKGFGSAGLTPERLDALLANDKSRTALESDKLIGAWNGAAPHVAATPEKTEPSAAEKDLQQTLDKIYAETNSRNIGGFAGSIKHYTGWAISRFSHNTDLLIRAANLCMRVSKNVPYLTREYSALALNAYKPVYDAGIRKEDFLLNYVAALLKTKRLEEVRLILKEWGEVDKIEQSPKQLLAWGDYMAQQLYRTCTDEISQLGGMILAVYLKAYELGLDSELLREATDNKISAISRKGFMASSFASAREYIWAQTHPEQAARMQTPRPAPQGLDNIPSS